MEMIQFLEADKEQLYGSITQAGTPEQVEGVIEKELDRLLLRYNEECKEERVRDTARYMLQTAKTMSPMISAAGETRVWERSTSGATGGETKWSKTAIISLAGGVLFLAGALLGLAVAAGSGLSFTSLLGSIPAAILGGALLFWSGRLSLIRNAESGGGAGKGGAAQVEIRVNPDKVWSCLRTTVLAMDKNLQEAAEVVRYEKNSLSASVGNGITPEEADLFAAILESAYSQKNDVPDDASALETISAVRYYLHRKQVETVDYGNGKREWFELLPGKQGMTLRPALTRDGALIRKGLAVSPQ